MNLKKILNSGWLQFIEIVWYKIDKSNLYEYLQFYGFAFYILELYFLYFYLTPLSIYYACSIALA